MNWLPVDSDEQKELNLRQRSIEDIYDPAAARAPSTLFENITSKQAVDMIHQEMSRRKAMQDDWIVQQCVAEETELFQCESSYTLKAVSAVMCASLVANLLNCKRNNRVIAEEKRAEWLQNKKFDWESDYKESREKQKEEDIALAEARRRRKRLEQKDQQ